MSLTRKIPLTVIRPATVADIATIYRLAEATWWVTYRGIITDEQIRYMLDRMYAPAELEAQMVVHGHRFLLARHGGRYAGFASFSLRDPRSRVYRLHKLYVRPDYQGTGLGRKLIQAVETRARQLGGTQLELNVNRANPALHFYERQGYRIQQVVDIPYGPYWLNDYVLARPLTAPAGGGTGSPTMRVVR